MHPQPTYALHSLCFLGRDTTAGTVRSVNVAGSNAYVGDSNGLIHWYEIRSSEWHWKRAVQLSQSRAVERIVVLVHIGLVVVLCEANVTFLRYPTLAQTSLAQIRTVVEIVWDEAGTLDGPVSLCLLRRRSVSLFMLESNSCVPICDIPLERGAVIARRFNEMVCCATPSDYALVDLDSCTQFPIGLPISRSTKVPSAQVRPSIIAVPDKGATSCTFIITSHSDAGTIGALVRQNGEPTGGIVEWQAHPRALALDYPYLCALLRNDTLAVHDLRTPAHIQSIRVPSSSRSLANITPILGDEHNEPVRILLCAKDQLYMVERSSPQGVAHALANAGQLRLAAETLEGCSDNQATRNEALELALRHFVNARFCVAAPLLIKAKTDGRQLLSRFERFAALQDAPSGRWESVPTVEHIISSNMAQNYPSLADDQIITDLSATILRRAYEMLMDVLEHFDDDVSHTALLELKLEKDPKVNAAELMPHITHCGESAIAILDGHCRFVLKGRLLERVGRIDEAIETYLKVYDGYLQDNDSVDFSHIVSLAAGQRTVSHSLWVAKYDIVQGAKLLKDADLGPDPVNTINALGTMDVKAADDLLEHTALKRGGALHEMLLSRLIECCTTPDTSSSSVVRTKLAILLEYSSEIDLEAVVLDSDNLVYERAIVLNRLGKYKDALNVLMYLSDTQSAEDLCFHGHVLPPKRVYNLFKQYPDLEPFSILVTHDNEVDESLRRDLARYLCNLFLTNPNDNFSTAASHLLNNHPSLFDPMHILKTVAPSMPLSELNPFFRHAIMSSSARLRRAQVIKALEYGQNIAVAEAHWKTARSLGGVLEGDEESKKGQRNGASEVGTGVDVAYKLDLSGEKDEVRTDEKR